ncbi:MAG TPA: hypothetical protein VMS31_23060, partial [Pyrinomonadaceae bacterium]|nr:hypothetical protein [Pyrinomonadaceae bacterium]
RRGGCSSRLGSPNVMRGNRRAASASARGPWPHSLACMPLGARKSHSRQRVRAEERRETVRRRTDVASCNGIRARRSDAREPDAARRAARTLSVAA